MGVSHPFPAQADLCLRGVLVRYARRGHADVAVVVDDVVFLPDEEDDEAAPPPPDWQTDCTLVSGQAPPSDAPARVRCRAPFTAPLRDVLKRCTAHGLVLGARDAFPDALRPDLLKAADAVGRRFDAALRTGKAPRVVLFLAEELLLVDALLADDPADLPRVVTRRGPPAVAGRGAPRAAIPQTARVLRVVSDAGS